MSKEDLWKALGRCQVDLDFAAKARNNPERCLLDARISLEQPELNQFKQQVLLLNPNSIWSPEGFPPPLEGADPLSMQERHDLGRSREHHQGQHAGSGTY